MTDRDTRRRPLLDLVLVTVALLPLMGAAWASVGPWEALVPLAVAVVPWAMGRREGVGAVEGGH